MLKFLLKYLKIKIFLPDIVLFVEMCYTFQRGDYLTANKRNNLSRRFDPFLSMVVIITVIMGFMAISSATNSLDKTRYLLVQGAAVLLGISLLIIIQRFDYGKIGNLAHYIYILNVFLLTLVLFIGKGDEVGTRGWIDRKSVV